MQKKKNRVVRDPYYHWKIMNMVLACAILILAVLVLCGREAKYLFSRRGDVRAVGDHGAGEEQEGNRLSLLCVFGDSGGGVDF